MTSAQPRATPEQTAFALYLAGRTHEEIRAATNLTSRKVKSVTEDRVSGRDLELQRLERLWSRHYPKALSGDIESTAVCMRITAARVQINRTWRATDGGRGAEVAVLGGPDEIQQAWRMLAGGAPGAVAALIDIAQHGQTDASRVRASVAILDRVGLNAKQDITVRTVPAEFDMAGPADEKASPADIIRRRLETIRDRTVSEGAEIVDAELVTDVPPTG